MAITREERNKRRLAYYYKNKERDNPKRAAYYAANREAVKAKATEWWRRNKDRANAKRNQRRRTPEYKARRNEQLRAWRAAGGTTPRGKSYPRMPDPKYKAAVLDHYGKHCQCCGENCIKLLTVDHINDNGRDHGAKNTRYKGEALYRHLIRIEYPTGIQILCFNCNIGKRNNKGICPHRAPAGVAINKTIKSSP